MLKITRVDEGNFTEFKLEGKLARSWVETMEQAWRQAVADSAGRSLVIDLTAVAYVDARGTELLTEMHRHGAELRASSYLARSIVEEIKSRRGEPAKAGH